MNETQHQDRPTTTDPETETEEFADVTLRAEEGDEAEVEAESEPAPEDDITDVATEEATVLEAEAEEALPEDIIEGEDEGPLVATGPDRYVAEEAQPEE